MSVQNQRGTVLLLVLIVVALLSALLTDWAFSTLVDMRLTETFRDSNRAYYLARGGVEVGRQLLSIDNNLYDAPTEMWGVGVPSYPVSDDATVSITLVDEDSRFNLNQLVDGAGNAHVVNRERFRRLLSSLDISDPVALSDALIDWIDIGDVSSPSGVENSWYQSLTPPMTCKNDKLDTVDELLLVKGFTPEIVQKLTPHVTVAGVSKLNVNTASKELLLVWHKDLTPSGIEQLLTARQDKPFKTLAEVQAAIDVTNYGNLVEQGDIAVTSQFYRITSVAQVNDGVRTVEALIKKDGNSQLWRRVY